MSLNVLYGAIYSINWKTKQNGTASHWGGAFLMREVGNEVNPH